MKATFLLAFACGLSITAASGQNVETSLTNVYQDKILALRHSFKSAKQDYASDGTPTKSEEEGPWTLYGRMIVKKINLDREQLQIEGTRALYFFDRSGNLSQFKDDRKHPAASLDITVRLRQPLSSTDEARAILGRVFALTPEEMVHSVPAYWQPHLAKQLGVELPNKTGFEHATVTGEAGGIKTPQEVLKLADFTDKKHYRVPKIITAVEPEFSEEARSRGFQGVVSLNITIDPAGRVSDVTIIHPLGMGLDEKAMDCVKAWRFAPAKHDGQPVAVALVYIEVDFHL